MTITKTPLSGLYTIKLEAFPDDRGYFMKVWSRDFFAQNGISENFAEENHSCSKKNVVRGLHFQYRPPLGKLMRVLQGRAYVTAVDIRKKSKTFGKWYGQELSEKNPMLLYGSPGFAMGFLSLEDDTVVQYHYTVPYNGAGESVILWNDPKIRIKWPLSGKPILSKRDKSAQTLEEWLKRPESDIF